MADFGVTFWNEELTDNPYVAASVIIERNVLNIRDVMLALGQLVL
jgi:hypothetical protein